MKTLIEMAKAAGLFTHKEVQPELERFAELVRADAIAAEREACAQLAITIAEQDLPDEMPEGEELLRAVRQIVIGGLIAKTIRARSRND